MSKLTTKYKIRAQIPASVVESLDLVKKASEIGVDLRPDDSGNLEGTWSEDLLSLDERITQLKSVGLKSFMIQRSAVSFVVSASDSLLASVCQVLKEAASGAIAETTELFTGETVLSCVVACERASDARDALRDLGIAKMIATECFTLVKEKTE